MNTSKHLSQQSCITHSIRLRFKEIWSATCLTWGSPSPLSIKQINKTTALYHPAKRSPFLWCRITRQCNNKDQPERACMGFFSRSCSKALAMPFIHYEWSSPQAEKQETICLWAWRRWALIIDSLSLFFTHKVLVRPERTCELEKQERIEEKRASPSRETLIGGFKPGLNWNVMVLLEYENGKRRRRRRKDNRSTLSSWCFIAVRRRTKKNKKVE